MQILTSRAGSAGGPKPGRAGFYLELGGCLGWVTCKDYEMPELATPTLTLRQSQAMLTFTHQPNEQKVEPGVPGTMCEHTDVAQRSDLRVAWPRDQRENDKASAAFLQ